LSLQLHIYIFSHNRPLFFRSHKHVNTNLLRLHLYMCHTIIHPNFNSCCKSINALLFMIMYNELYFWRNYIYIYYLSCNNKRINSYDYLFISTQSNYFAKCNFWKQIFFANTVNIIYIKIEKSQSQRIH